MQQHTALHQLFRGWSGMHLSRTTISDKVWHKFPSTRIILAYFRNSYVRSLEERVAYLETQLQNGLSVSQEASDHHPTLNNLKSPRPQTSSSAVTQPCPSNDMQGDFPLVSLYSSTEHSFLGSTSGYPLSRMLQSVVNKQLIVGDGTQSRSYTMGEIKSAKPARMPSDEESDMLLQVYWSKFHAKHPFLSRNEILNLNKQRHELSAQRNDINPQKLHSSPRPVRATSRKLHLSLFKLNMIYAISARYIQLRQAKETENTPEVRIGDLYTTYPLLKTIGILQCGISRD